MRDNDLLEELAGDILRDDMPSEDMKMVVDELGIDTARLMLRKMAGIQIYVPSGWWKIPVARYIDKNYRRVDVKHLALTCGVSERHVRNMIRQKKAEANQTRLFDVQDHET